MEVIAQDLFVPPLPLMTLKQFLQCENQLEVNINMRKQFEHVESEVRRVNSLLEILYHKLSLMK
ncbi:hypothetical protein ALC53_00606 [Atta colombica]|uniref:Uncharacterized protein n=1 Tax=Atta colombica TaxID=520822 RepID=A0A151I6P0_9HYME|nr:hypothetical protein ALC53_00606 [Atta colombica]